VWAEFRPHHYLSGQLARGAQCYVALWSGRRAAFCAVLGQIGHAGRKRITRLVTLPPFQGLGIGMRLAEYVCRLEAERGFRVSLATSHPAVIASCRRSPRWHFLGIKRCGGTPQCIRGRPLAGSTGRIVAAFEFVLC
jgi:GNAT superfamily N-acetyltransferase